MKENLTILCTDWPQESTKGTEIQAKIVNTQNATFKHDSSSDADAQL